HKEVQSACVKPVGEGDGGGGTLRADLEMARRLGDLEGAPRAAWKTVSGALDDIFSGGGELPEWRGELYLELHRGTYTTQAETKRNNRLLEFALRRAELFCAFAAVTGRGEYPYETLLDFWKRALTYQFHDIIPGSSIGRVYAEAESDSKEMLARLAQISRDAGAGLAGLNESASGAGPAEPPGLLVFNDLSWERGSAARFSPADLPPELRDAGALRDSAGSVCPVQRYTDFDGKAQAVFAPKAPPLGWARYAAVSRDASGTAAASPFSWQGDRLETPFYIITFNESGQIASLVDRRRDFEMVAPGGVFNAFVIAEDVPVFWDAWDIEADWVRRVRTETRLAGTEAAADGPVCFRLRRVYEIGAGAKDGGASSRLVQDMVCYSGDPRIDFETKVDWHEKWRLLKAEFDTAVNAAQVRCEVQYGHIWRNTHRSTMQDRAKFEMCAHKWISLEEEGGGIALLNDCKYGHDVEGGRMRLSLLRSPCAPDPDADRGLRRFTYSLLPFTGNFGNSGVIRSAYELNSPADVLACAWPLGGDSAPGAERSLCAVEGNSVVVESVKAPENGACGELVFRLYESLGGRCRAGMLFSRELSRAAETDMLEDNPKELPVNGRRLGLEFRPFEIKTVKVRFRD
ncbi:MAG: glycosyl hydrolase-related protein, partial [Treponema sp.]|nr:glycosyl hydrolase-related protein [Treponema sp.]